MTGYVSSHAHRLAAKRKKFAARRSRLKCESIRQYVRSMLSFGWTPAIIASLIENAFPGQQLSHEAIYQYIYADWPYGIRYLPRRHKQRYPRTFSRKRCGKAIFKNRVSIQERPEHINNRSEFGHWESDSIESRQSSAIINVLHERKSRFVKLSLVANKQAVSTENAIRKQLEKLSQNARKSITYDNGTENGNYEGINIALGTKAYFCQPCQSWQKGAVENTNGLIRRWLPQGTDLAKIGQEQLDHIAFWLNTRPRKCLSFKTPLEVFLNNCGAIAC